MGRMADQNELGNEVLGGFSGGKDNSFPFDAMKLKVGDRLQVQLPELLCVPCKGTIDSSVQIRPGQLSLRPEVQGAVQEVTNGLKHFLKRSRRRSTGSAGRNVSEH